MPTPPDPLRIHTLRPLTLNPHEHPHAQPHLSAASGLVCMLGRVYVIGDDEHHVAVYSDRYSPGSLHRVKRGALPRDEAQRKRRKADFEVLMRVPNQAVLLGVGSGSRPRRDGGFRVSLGPDGWPRGGVQPFDLRPMYGPLREQLGPINIEGAVVLGTQVVLLNRGQAEAAGNLAISYRLRDLLAVVNGRSRAITPYSMRSFDLGHVHGVPFGFTDAAALPGSSGAWLFSAVAEDTDNSYDDGACRGAMVGLVDAAGRLRWRRLITREHKIEGIDVQRQRGGTALFMTTDADDPSRAACLLSAWL